MLNTVKRSMRYNQTLNMIYMDGNGGITKRRIKVLKVSGGSIRAYCYLRRSTRTFKIDNVLALAPVTTRESMVI